MEHRQKKDSACRGVLRRLAALALAAALLLGLAACEGAAASLAAQICGGSTAAGESTAAPAVEGSLEVHFIDVGQALSVLVKCDGQAMLYDGGNVADGDLVVRYLRGQGVERLEYVFCSHAHEDHVGGLSAVLEAVPAGHVYSPVTQAEDSVSFTRFAQTVQQLGMQIEVPAAGNSWTLGGATVRQLGPLHAQEDNVNNSSLVLRIDYGGTSVLLTGDMEADAERELVESGADLDADVLQVGHHGSSSSTCYVFLNAVLPEIAVISCGANNDYGHPHEETLSRLHDEGAALYRTDQQGTIVVTSDGTRCTANAQGPAQ